MPKRKTKTAEAYPEDVPERSSTTEMLVTLDEDAHDLDQAEQFRGRVVDALNTIARLVEADEDEEYASEALALVGACFARLGLISHSEMRVLITHYCER